MWMLLLGIVINLLLATPVHTAWFTLTPQRIQEAIAYGRSHHADATSKFRKEWTVLQPEVRSAKPIPPARPEPLAFEAFLATRFATVATMERERSLHNDPPLTVQEWHRLLEGTRQGLLFFQVAVIGKADEWHGLQAALHHRGRAITILERKICGNETREAGEVPIGLVPTGQEKLDVTYFCLIFPREDIGEGSVVDLVVSRPPSPAESWFTFDLATMR